MSLPVVASSGQPSALIRGVPFGWTHDPVVKMWPQKWYASASPGSIARPTMLPAVAAIIAPRRGR